VSGAITGATVDGLEVAWQSPIFGRGPYGAAAGGLVIADGVVYFQDLGSDTSAIDLQTGEVLWRTAGVALVAGPNGAAVADGRVFVSRGVGVFSALDADSGEVIWSVELEKDGFQPSVAGDLVLVGTGNLAHVAGNSGFVHAFDVETGERRWSFQVVEDGFWGDPQLNSGGGVWYPPAIDLERGLVYYGTGNAGPYPGTVEFPNGSSRPGGNLYTSSIVALEIETGELAWYHQVVPHGLFDHDFQLSPVLTDTTIDGEQRALAIGAGKVGEVVAFDLKTGAVVWQTEVGEHENDDLEALPLGAVVEVSPGIFGGVETPLALADGLVFAPTLNVPTAHTATGRGATDGSSALLNAGAATDLSQATAEMVALDVSTGEVVWTQPFDSPLFGGATAVGDLVFTATYDGAIVALRQEDGVEVWRYETGGGINAWPAVQDDTIVWPIGLGGQPRVVAFRLPALSEEGSLSSPAGE
jgi:glucose dehydrogenase